MNVERIKELGIIYFTTSFHLKFEELKITVTFQTKNHPEKFLHVTVSDFSELDEKITKEVEEYNRYVSNYF